MSEFFQTQMGRKFYEADVPNLILQMKRMADSLDRATKLKALEPTLSEPHEPVDRTEYVVRLERENRALRGIVSDCSAALGNGSGCAPEASLEFMSLLPSEIAAEVQALRKELARTAEMQSALASISLMEYESTSSASEKVHAAARKARFALHSDKPGDGQ